jgi:endonuclease I
LPSKIAIISEQKKLSRHLSKLAFAVALSLLFLLATRTWADAYDPPPTYYSAATGTGATLMNQLDTIMTTGQQLPTYGDARTLLAETDEDPNNHNNVLLVYNRMSVSKTFVGNSNQFGTREHVWPSSFRPDGAPDNNTRNIGSDLHILKPLDQSTNSSRGNTGFGPVIGSGTNGAQGGYYYPGDADRGDVARIIFYGGTRWKDEGLKVVNGQGDQASFAMGDLASLIVWHFADPPDTFERRRNQIIFQDQGNRNAFIDRPEYAWSVYMNQTNDSQITIAGTTPDANGGSMKNIDFGRVFVGAAVSVSQSFTLAKGGLNGTYYSVTTSGEATSSVNGRYNAFRTNQTDSKSIDVGLNATTTTAGMHSGTVTVDNLDVTTMGGAGHGANDANDVFNLSINVLDHAKPSFTSPSTTTSLSHNFGVVAAGSTSPTFNFDIFDLNTTVGSTANLDVDGITLISGNPGAFSTNVTPLSIAAGLGHTFAAMINTATTGTFSGTYLLSLSDENLTGAQNKSIFLTLSGQIAPAVLAGDYDNNGVVDAADYVTWRKSLAAGTSLPHNETATVGVTDQQDYDVWRQNFGATGSGSGSSLNSTAGSVPEPASTALLVIALTGMHLVSMRRRSPRR